MFYLTQNNHQSLANLGIVAFVATLQFLPGVLSVLYWPTANRRGFIAGLLAGTLVWLVTMLLPLLGKLESPLPLPESISSPVIKRGLPPGGGGGPLPQGATAKTMEKP